MTIKSKNRSEVTSLSKSTYEILTAANQVRIIASSPMADKPTRASFDALKEAVEELNNQFNKLKKREWKKPGSGHQVLAMMRGMGE